MGMDSLYRDPRIRASFSRFFTDIRVTSAVLRGRCRDSEAFSRLLSEVVRLVFDHDLAVAERALNTVPPPNRCTPDTPDPGERTGSTAAMPQPAESAPPARQG